MIYLLILFLLLYCTYHFDYLEKKKHRNTFYFAILIALILLAGFRYRIGVDTIRYASLFKSIPTLSDWNQIDFAAENFEPLYYLFSMLSKSISSEFWGMQMLQAILVNIAVFVFIKRYTHNMFLGILLYYTFLYLSFMCEVMREACAVSMFLFSWKYLVERRWVKYYLFCILAFLFHSSEILLFILPFLRLLHLEKFICLNRGTFLFLLIVLGLGFAIQHLFFDYISILAFNERIENKITAYTDSSLSGTILNINGILSIIIMYVFYPLAALLLLKRKYSLKGISYEPMILLCSVFALLSIPLGILYRYNNYFMLFSIVALSDLAYSQRLSIKKGVYINSSRFSLWILLFFPLFFLRVYSYFPTIPKTQCKNYMRYYPYSSIFDETRDYDREKLFIHYHAY